MLDQTAVEKLIKKAYQYPALAHTYATELDRLFATLSNFPNCKVSRKLVVVHYFWENTIQLGNCMERTINMENSETLDYPIRNMDVV